MQTVRSFCRNHWGNVRRALPQCLQVGRACARLVFLLWLVVTGGVRHKPAERVFLFPYYVMTIPDQSVPGEFTRWERGCGHLSGYRNTTNYFQPRNESFLVAQLVKNPPATQETQVWSPGREDPPEEDMATHSSILAWRIPWTEGGWWATAQGVAKSQTWLRD